MAGTNVFSISFEYLKPSLVIRESKLWYLTLEKNFMENNDKFLVVSHFVTTQLL